MRVSRSAPGKASFLRHAAESLILLAIAVIFFRGFAIEGYLISTGSMAPTLLGYHKRIVCPQCQIVFARGDAFDHDDGNGDYVWADFDSEEPADLSAHCPNCSMVGIHATDLPRNEGDQLLVHKHAYEFRDPRRWEVIVFRNPTDPRQAYVKRVAGLPGERLRIQQGDVFADGTLCRKPWAVQAGMRIPVHAYAHAPLDEDEDWQPRWHSLNPQSEWELHPEILEFYGAAPEASNRTDWVEYRHWIRTGGLHVTSTPLSAWPAKLVAPDADSFGMTYNDGKLIVRGALSDAERQRWLSRSNDPNFIAAVNELFERSHVAPLTDEYGYNAEPPVVHPLNDVMVSLELTDVQGNGRFEAELEDGKDRFRVVFDFADKSVELLRNNDPVPIRAGSFSDVDLTAPMQLDFSLFDRQAVLAVNGDEVFEAYEYAESGDRPAVSRPARLGASRLDCCVSRLVLYRDVYFTDSPDRAGEYVLDVDSFFVLGDNSPVSLDSRAWEDPGVPRSALIGKPLVVHLPSRPGLVEWNGARRYVRVPDFARMRFVR